MRSANIEEMKKPLFINFKLPIYIKNVTVFPNTVYKLKPHKQNNSRLNYFACEAGGG